jgi:hypothetical protein
MLDARLAQLGTSGIARHCEKRSDAAIQAEPGKSWIASLGSP